MKHIPGGREVERSLKGTLNEVRSAIKQIKEYASKMLAKGDYGGAEELIPKAREVEVFEGEVEALYKRWRKIQGGSDEADGVKEKLVPLWKYYVPTLRSLMELGGSARREAIENKVEPLVRELSVENGSNSEGAPPKWRTMVNRALRAMKKEGFLQREKKEWRITPSGRKAAEAKWKEGSQLKAINGGL